MLMTNKLSRGLAQVCSQKLASPVFALCLALTPLASQAAEEANAAGSFTEETFSNAPLEPVRVLLVAHLETTLSSEVAARINALPVKTGERFKKGSLLVGFDCRLLQAQLRKAQAQLQAARKTLSANQKLAEYKAISQLEVAVAQAEEIKASADVQWSSTQVNLCKITAPFSGAVVKLHTALHAGVPAGTPLMDIIDDSRLEMQLNVPSNWLQWLKAGTEFNVEIEETATKHKAKISRIGAKVEAVSRTVEVFAEITDKASELRPGMSGVAHFER